MKKTVKVKAHIRKPPSRWKDEAQKFLREAKKEIKKFKETENEIYLRQAGEKVWIAFVNLLKHKGQADSVSARGRRYLAKKYGLLSLY
ncbi:MAG: hypothetical protein ACTSV7_14815, partial [Candidatus Baldrarchaeia archaeon]